MQAIPEASHPTPAARGTVRFLDGGGEMGALIRAHDWDATELGAPQTWPAALRTTLRMMLTTQHPVFVFWGPGRRCFYNDAYGRSLGAERHPGILGRRGASAWAEIWPQIGPEIEQVMAGGGATWHENQLLPITRHGQLQQVYWTYGYTPIDDDSTATGIGGVLVLVTETTRAMLMQRRLESSEARWRSLFEQTPGFVCILDGPEHRFEFTNPHYQALLGGRPLLGLPVREAVPEAEGQGFFELLDAVHAEGVARTGTAVPLTLVDPADGEPKALFVDFVYQPIHDEDGTVRGIFVQGSDVTDRVRSHAALAANEARYRALVENLPGGAVFVVDRSMRYVMASGDALKAAGISGTSMVGRTVAECFGTARAAFFESYYRQALAGAGFEASHEEAGRSFLTRGTPLRDASGVVTGALAVSYDLTSVRATEAQLLKAATKLQGVLASAEVGIWTWDMVSNRIEQDANVARLYGLPEGEECDAEAHWRRIVEDDRANVREAVAQARATGTFYVREYRVQLDDGSIRWLAGRGLLNRDAGGEPLSLSGLVIDITDLKKLEEALQATDRQKDEFLAMLAHELRNPLAPISSAADALLRVQTTDPDARNAAEVIRRQSRQLSVLVDDLLDVARIAQRRIELHQRGVWLSDLMADAVEASQPFVQAKGHRLTVTGNGRLQVWGDPVRLVQCLVNLLTNAARYTDAGGTIRLDCDADGDEVVLSVADNGSGIAPDLLPHVFDLFVQSDRAPDRSHGGLGIGLSIVKRLVELHGGRVAAGSRGKDLGSTFELRLPVHRGPEVAESPVPAASDARLRILIVDDNVDAAESLSRLLALDGHETRTAHASAEALDLVERTRPDVVLLDIGLPEMDGLQVARCIRRSDALDGVALVALTGYGQAEDKARSLAAGFDEHLVKPVSADRLLHVLQTALATRRYRVEAARDAGAAGPSSSKGRPT